MRRSTRLVCALSPSTSCERERARADVQSSYRPIPLLSKQPPFSPSPSSLPPLLSLQSQTMPPPLSKSRRSSESTRRWPTSPTETSTPESPSTRCVFPRRFLARSFPSISGAHPPALDAVDSIHCRGPLRQGQGRHRARRHGGGHAAPSVSLGASRFAASLLYLLICCLFRLLLHL
jgi:hypothetical protein